MTDTSPQAIAAYWHTQGQALVTHAGKTLAGWGFEAVTVDLLATGELPTDAAPYLSFDTSLARLTLPYYFLKPVSAVASRSIFSH